MRFLMSICSQRTVPVEQPRLTFDVKSALQTLNLDRIFRLSNSYIGFSLNLLSMVRI
jgi:hypothetical protein